MIIEKDLTKQPIAPSLSLAYKDGRIIGNLIYEETSLTIKVELEDNYVLLSEMSCDIHKYLNNQIIPYWDEIKNFKLLYVPIEIPHISSKGFWYEITVTIDDADSTIKHITGTLAQYAELNHVKNYDVEIRTQNDIDRDDYVDAVFYDPNNPEASIINRVLKDKASHYSIHHVDTSLYDVKRTFSFSGQSVLECLKDICEEVDCIMIFGETESADHTFHRTISFYDAKDYCPACGKRGDFTNGCSNPDCGHDEDIIPRYGEDTGLFINKDNLGEEINLETNIDDIINCYRLTAGDDDMTAAVINCNPSGSRYIWHFTDEMKSDMSSALRTAVNNYEIAMNIYKISYQMSGVSQSSINSYNSYVNTYQDYSSETLNTITYPITGYVNLIRAYYYISYLHGFLNTVMMPFSPEVDDTTAQAQMALFTPTTIGVKGLASITKTTSATEIKELVKVYVDTSRYSIDVTTTTYSKPTWTGKIKLTSYTDEDDTYEATYGAINPLTFTEATDTYIKNQIDKLLKKHETSITGIVSLINASTNNFMTEIAKYNLMSLNNIYAVIDAVLKIMDDAEVTQASDSDVYSQYYDPLLAKKNAMGSVISGRETEVDTLQSLLESIEEQKATINEALSLEDYLGETLWSELVLFRREGDLTNTSFISTGMNDKEILDNAMDFYDRAVEDIEKQAELQYTISSDLKNFLLMSNEIYDNYTPVFDVGNWMRIEVDEKIYKLRLVEYEINFDDLTTINVEFTDCKKSNDITSQFAEYRKTINSVKKETTSIKKEIEDVQEETHIFVDAVSDSAITSDAIIVEDTGETLTEHLRSTATDNAINIDNAKKVATNYMSSDNTGIMVADMTDGVEKLPSDTTLTGSNVFITAGYGSGNTAVPAGVHIRDGKTDIARFGATVKIGGNDNTYGYLYEDYHSLQMIDRNENNYFYISDLRNSDGVAQLTEVFYGNGIDTQFELSFTATSRDYTVVTSDSSVPSLKQLYGFSFENAPAQNVKITVTYESDSQFLKAYTLGKRADSSNIGAYSFAEGYNIKAEGNFSHAEGYQAKASGYCAHAEGSTTTAEGWYSHAEGIESQAIGMFSHAEGYSEARGSFSHAQNETIAQSPFQTTLGKHNIIDNDEKYPFIIGNGSDYYNARSNALTVSWDGDIKIDTTFRQNGSIGSVDIALYNAITALGWEGDVIV